MKKEIRLNNEILVNKVFRILRKFQDDPKKIENIFGKTSKSYSKRQINYQFLVSK